MNRPGSGWDSDQLVWVLSRWWCRHSGPKLLSLELCTRDSGNLTGGPALRRHEVVGVARYDQRRSSRTQLHARGIVGNGALFANHRMGAFTSDCGGYSCRAS